MLHILKRTASEKLAQAGASEPAKAVLEKELESLLEFFVELRPNLQIAITNGVS